MTILSRYILREYAKVFFLCLAGLMTVYLVVDFFEKIRKFVHHDAALGTVLEFFVLRIPAISFQMTPLAVLMATLLTLGMLARNQEITAMRSCGISLYRISWPFLCFALAVSFALLAVSAVIMPVSTVKAEYVKTTKIEKKDPVPAIVAMRPWVQIGEQTLLNVDVVDPEGPILHGVTLYQLNEQFQVTAITEAREARFTGQTWVLMDGVRRQLLPDGRTLAHPFEEWPAPLTRTPQDLQTWLATESEAMTLMDLDAYISRLRRGGYKVADYLTDYHGRIAFPFVSVVMVVVGIALSLRRSGVRGSGMAIGIGQALAIGFLYWTAHSVAIALGRSGALAPLLAGWIANLLFLSFGSYLFLKVRQ
ncbi:MAG: LPS export ABC transporter permease LptG [Nitrospirales bacterium]